MNKSGHVALSLIGRERNAVSCYWECGDLCLLAIGKEPWVLSISLDEINA